MFRYVIGISVVTVAVIVLRLLSDGTIRRKYQYAMWLVIPMFMVLFPFVNIDVTLPNMPVHHEETAVIESQENIDTYEYIASVPSGQQNATIERITLFVSVGIITVLTVYNTGFVIYVSLKRSFLRKNDASGLNVYTINLRATPFLLGRSIYVGSEDEGFSKYVICHETCHYKHKDMVWNALRYIVLALNWYNPFIWVAFARSGLDCELACDEDVLATLGHSEASEYGKVIIEIVKRKNAVTFNPSITTGMWGAFEASKKRITSIKHPIKNNKAVLGIVMAVLLITAGCSMVKYKSAADYSLDERLIGEWDYNTYHAKSNNVVGYTFNDDNTGSVTLDWYGVERDVDFMYSADGEYISFYAEGEESRRLRYCVEGNVMIIVGDQQAGFRRRDNIINAA